VFQLIERELGRARTSHQVDNVEILEKQTEILTQKQTFNYVVSVVTARNIKIVNLKIEKIKR
jgi:3-phenylpropionate/cinnamic acid dioxygenase small subunit